LLLELPVPRAAAGAEAAEVAKTGVAPEGAEEPPAEAAADAPDAPQE
jgi:hypothetical protein